jgi:hypothetical protein
VCKLSVRHAAAIVLFAFVGFASESALRELVAAEFEWQFAPLEIASQDVRPEITLGTLRPGESRMLKVPLLNPTSSTIFVQQIETSCGCSSVSISEESIEAGLTAHLLITVKAPDSYGTASFSITLRSGHNASVSSQDEEMNRSEYVDYSDTFRFSAMVRDSCTIFPIRPVLRSALDPDVPSLQIRIENHSGSPWINPEVQFTDVDVPFSVREEGFDVNGESHQVLTVAVNRYELSQRLKSVATWPSSIKLLVFSQGAGANTRQLLGEREVQLLGCDLPGARGTS